MFKKKETKMETPANTEELRNFLMERMVKLITGEETLQHSQAVAALAKQANATLALELQAARILGKSETLQPLAIK